MFAATPIARSIKPSSFGQPTKQFHPNLLRANELTPGISVQEYDARRRKLLNSLPDSSLIVAVAAPVKYMSQNIFYKYRQSSDFWYLTGFEEPESAIILEKNSSSKGYKMTLFAAGKDPSTEKWDGPRTSLSDITTHFRAAESLPITSFSSTLRSLLPLYSHIYADLPPRPRSRSSLLEALSRSYKLKNGETDAALAALASANTRPLAPELAKCRLIKSESEQRVMRAAAEISSRAHSKTMRFAAPGKSESELAAHFEYICALQGAQRLAYVPVVASGPNALIIHYTANNQVINPDELVLIDAGCEYNGYASDITRTFPASGIFTEPQSALYSAVLSAQKQLVALCTARSSMSLHDLHRSSCNLLRTELKQIGFDLPFGRGDLTQVYPHFLTHPIGVDLHESTHVDRTKPIQAGMVITIEPGVYVPPSPSFPKHFHNLGVRIEDEVLVGEEHPIVLSVSAPKEIVDVEGACQGLLGLGPYLPDSMHSTQQESLL